jgi:predicted Fe-S protein YdhL (DUF1289 family)
MSITPVNSSHTSPPQADSISSNIDPIPVKSPCVSVCALDAEGMCTGCFRTGDEIRLWGAYSNGERLNVLRLVHEREKKVNPFL